MSDDDLAQALAFALVLEKRARVYWQSTPAPSLDERDAALTVVRHATAVIRSVESWMAVRATAAAEEMRQT